MVSAGLVFFFNFDIQGYVGAAISVLILKASYDILKEMYNHLLGVRADDNLVREIKETIAQHPNVGGVYDLVLNSYGPGETIGSRSYYSARYDDDGGYPSTNKRYRCSSL